MPLKARDSIGVVQWVVGRKKRLPGDGVKQGKVRGLQLDLGHLFAVDGDQPLPEVSAELEGRVVRLANFGAFVNLLGGAALRFERSLLLSTATVDTTVPTISAAETERTFLSAI